MSTIEPKKRGRKKKNTGCETEILPKAEKILNKRGRKAKVVDFKKNQDIKLTNFNINETYILYLPISINELLKDIPEQLGIERILMQNPILPVPYNSNNNTNTNNNTKVIKTDNTSIVYEKVKKENIQVYNSTDIKGNAEIIKVYDDSILSTELDFENIKRITVSKTSVACWWCCHQFDTYPVCCPVKYNEKKDIFNVIGCFCSFNCAKSYSTTEYNSKYSIISFLYKKITKEFKNIKKAPPKTVLKMFGGPLTIEEYRDTFDTLSTITINKYPMIFIPTQVEYHKVNEMIKDSLNRISISKTKKTDISKKNINDASKRLSISKDMKKSNINLMDIMGIKLKN